MADGLFDADPFRAAPPPEPQLGQDARRTIRQAAALAEGRHPATGLHLHADAAPAADRQAAGLRCGACAFLFVKDIGRARTWSKCAMRFAGAGDVRRWWPACTAYKTTETPTKEN